MSEVYSDLDVKPGDRLTKFRWVVSGPWLTIDVLIDKVDTVGLWYTDGEGDHHTWHRFADGRLSIHLTRDNAAGAKPTPDAPSKSGRKAIPDWPLRCPRCQNANSAVLLFMGYDCKNGCYK